MLPVSTKPLFRKREQFCSVCEKKRNRYDMIRIQNNPSNIARYGEMFGIDFIERCKNRKDVRICKEHISGTPLEDRLKTSNLYHSKPEFVSIEEALSEGFPDPAEKEPSSEGAIRSLSDILATIDHPASNENKGNIPSTANSQSNIDLLSEIQLTDMPVLKDQTQNRCIVEDEPREELNSSSHFAYVSCEKGKIESLLNFCDNCSCDNVSVYFTTSGISIELFEAIKTEVDYNAGVKYGASESQELFGLKKGQLQYTLNKKNLGVLAYNIVLQKSYSKLSKGKNVCLPSCIVRQIRKEFPLETYIVRAPTSLNNMEWESHEVDF